MTGIYIHIPFCASKCGYCAFYSVTDTSDIPQYLDALETEIQKRTNSVKEKADTVYIGGGTPSVLPRGSIARVIKKLRECFLIVQSASVTVEANPDSCCGAFARECADSGVNRISLGLQSHSPSILKAAGRRHSADDFLRAVQHIKEAGIQDVAADLITGFANQTVQSVCQSINFLAELDAIKHISLYALTAEEGTPLYKTGFVPNADLQADMYAAGVKLLERLGYMRYEVSNFAKRGFESKHNKKYWSGEPYYGFGAGAHSFIRTPQNNPYVAERIENHSDLSVYNSGKFIKSRYPLTRDDRTKEIIMLSLRTREGLNFAQLTAETGYDLLHDKFGEISKLQDVGAVTVQDGCLRVANDYYYILDTILVKLLF
ncbi:MAG: radical SAM family heme chaperone HemW [Firmicutes bacterium]|nr:radical SAM family heme chaperone HemW [Bacillota bacterium]